MEPDERCEGARHASGVGSPASVVMGAGKAAGRGAAVAFRQRTPDIRVGPAWMGGRVVEGSGLENRQAGNRLVGSNPTPSAKLMLPGVPRPAET